MLKREVLPPFERLEYQDLEDVRLELERIQRKASRFDGVLVIIAAMICAGYAAFRVMELWPQ